MHDVDLRYVWGHGSVVFTSWFVPLGLLTRYFVLRRSTPAPLWSSLVADAAMGAVSWLFVVGLPVAIFAEALINAFILSRFSGSADPASWISVLILSALIAAYTEASVLRILFKRTLNRSAFGLLLVGDLACIAAAAYATVTYVLAPAIR